MQSNSAPRSVVVTGAASGIGRACAVRLATDGWAVVGVDRDADALAQLATELRAGGAVAAAVAGDVADRGVHERACEQARSLAPLGAWVGAAGLTHTHELTELDEAAARLLIDVNQLGLLWGAAAAVSEWTRTATDGVLVAISSVHGGRSYPHHTVYEMTKAAAEALVRSVAVTYGHRRIRAVGIAPGAVATPALLASLESAPDPDAARRHLEHQTPAQRIARPEEIAAAVAFALSADAGYISGTTIPVDGGWSAILSQPPRDETAVRPPGGVRQ